MECVPCAQCGVTFKRRTVRQIYCPPCAQERKKVRRQNGFEEATCPVCGRTFTPDTEFRVYCCLWCRREHDRERAKDYYVRVHSHKKK